MLSRVDQRGTHPCQHVSWHIEPNTSVMLLTTTKCWKHHVANIHFFQSTAVRRPRDSLPLHTIMEVPLLSPSIRQSGTSRLSHRNGVSHWAADHREQYAFHGSPWCRNRASRIGSSMDGTWTRFGSRCLEIKKRVKNSWRKGGKRRARSVRRRDIR